MVVDLKPSQDPRILSMICIFDESINQYQSMSVCSFKLPLQSPQLPTGRFFVAVFTTHSLMLYHHFSQGSSWTKDGCFAGRSERAVSAGRWSQNSFDGGERGGRLVTSGAMALEISDSLPEKKKHFCQYSPRHKFRKYRKYVSSVWSFKENKLI